MPFFKRKKSIAFFLLSVFIFTGILGSRRIPRAEPVYTNLKILSNKLSEEQMDAIMERFNSGLGVTCMYCHVLKKNVPYPEPIDFASDEKPAKERSREMLSMSMKINRKYFNIRMDNKLEIRPRIWCNTCHQGLLDPGQNGKP